MSVVLKIMRACLILFALCAALFGFFALTDASSLDRSESLTIMFLLLAVIGLGLVQIRLFRRHGRGER
jgi:O-antigen/teichoic acid export membrane protein